jgi:hypothetical protein
MAAGKLTNGVNLEPIGQFIEAVKSDPDVAHITFKASSVWRGGTQTSVTISEFLSNGGVASPTGRKFNLTVDEPNVLGGGDSSNIWRRACAVASRPESRPTRKCSAFPWRNWMWMSISIST